MYATIEEIQNRLLEMGKAIADILEKHNIRYMLAFGTLLGAVRHGGFIPWDDDFDLQIFWDDYDKAIEVLRNELPSDLFLEDSASEPKYFHAWAHVKDVNTIAECKEFPQDNYYLHKGISVDLYRIKEMPLSQLQDYINSENERYIMRRKEKGLMDEDEYIRRMNQLGENIEEAKKNVTSDDRPIMGFTTSHKRKYLEIEDVFPLKPIVFNDYAFMGPSKPENVVSALYGNYMELPPINKRRQHYDSVIFIGKSGQ